MLGPTQEQKDKARAMRGAGIPDTRIADEMNVDRTTIIRWLGPRGKPTPKPGKPDPLPTQPDDWPDDWTPQTLLDAGFDADRATQVFLVAQQGTPWVRRFLKRRIDINIAELGKPSEARLPNDSTGKQWRDALAGLPVLAEWLGCPEAAKLADLIRDRQPFTVGLEPTPADSGVVDRFIRRPARNARRVRQDTNRLVSARKGFGSAARSHVNAIKQRVGEIAYESALGLDANDRLPYAALTALIDRLAMVDNTWRPDGSADLWRTFLQIFKHEPVNGGRSADGK